MARAHVVLVANMPHSTKILVLGNRTCGYELYVDKRLPAEQINALHALVEQALNTSANRRADVPRSPHSTDHE